MRQQSLSLLICVLLLSALVMATGCAKKKIVPPDGSYTVKAPVPPSSTGPTALEPPSKWQKPKSYTINGKTYTTMSSAAGYAEEGYASWYGKDFHGRKTANGEVYDMYGMTAAHKLLPFNTPVRVTNLETGRSTILRVNDRGPFIKDRIIDLTYTAAQDIGMAETGVARVRVEALQEAGSSAVAEADLKDESAQPVKQAPKPSTLSVFAKPAMAAEPVAPARTPESFLPEGRYFVQIGAFGKQANADGLKERMEHQGRPCRVVHDEARDLWRVQVGPYAKVEQAEKAKDELAAVNDKSFVFAD